MLYSKQLDQLLPALAKAQTAFPAIPKNQTATVYTKRGSYEFSYADLGSILQAVTPALRVEGLLFVWRLQAAGAGVVRITYVRRYSVVGLLALVAEDDDDGSAASGQLIRRRAVVASTNGPAPEADVITDTGTPEASEPPPVAIPTDIGLPYGGQAISALKPAQLAMLVSKVARLVHDDGDRWVPLLAALQAEWAARLARGQRRPVMPASALGPDVPPPAISVASGPVLS